MSRPTPPRPSSDLPILDELGAEFEALLAAELRPPAAAPAGPAAPRFAPPPVAAPAGPAAPRFAPPPAAAPAPRRPRGRPSAPRVARRAALVLALLCLVGTGAFAARVGLGGRGGAYDSDPVVLGGGGRWEVSGHRHEGRLCLLLAVGADAVADDCGPSPGPRAVRATSVAAGARWVAGYAGAGVARVRVRVAGTTVVAPTRVPRDPAAAAGAGVPARLRWFAVALAPARGARSGPARVTPLDRDGRRVGAAALDCSLGVVGAACEHLVRATARRALEGRDG